LNTGYEPTTKTKVSHFFYVENLKVICKTEEELQNRCKVRTFSDDIHMEFGFDKCAKTVHQK
jgi:hypothetical protein